MASCLHSVLAYDPLLISQKGLTQTDNPRGGDRNTLLVKGKALSFLQICLLDTFSSHLMAV